MWAGGGEVDGVDRDVQRAGAEEAIYQPSIRSTGIGRLII